MSDDTPEKSRTKVSRPFFRVLPQWIYDSEVYAVLSAPEAWLLHLLAGQADEDIGGGSRRGCRFGAKCIRTSKLSESSVRKYLSRFERVGFIVKVGQGGGFSRANEYAIPGKPGELDHLRVEDDPRYKTAKTQREKQGSTLREKQGKPASDQGDAGRIPSARRANTLRETRANPPRERASHTTHTTSSVETAGAVSPAGKPPAHDEAPNTDASLIDTLARSIEQLDHVLDKPKAEQKRAARAARETAEKLAAMGCPDRRELRRRWRRLEDLAEDASIHDLPARWHELSEEAVEGPFPMRDAI